jgi:hypothetical protein
MTRRLVEWDMSLQSVPILWGGGFCTVMSPRPLLSGCRSAEDFVDVRWLGCCNREIGISLIKRYCRSTALSP